MPETQVRDVKGERAELLDEALTNFRADLAADRFASATGKFREAVNLSRAWEEMRTRVLRVGADEAKNLLPRNWRVAETLLAETRSIESDYAVPTALWDKVRAAQHDEVISNALYALDRTELLESAAKAREQVVSFLAAHPAESRLKERLLELDERLNPNKKEAVKADAPAKVETTVPVATATVESEAAKATAAGQRVKITITSTAWDKVKTALSIAGSGTMIIAAATLLWIHYQHPSAFKKSPRKAAPVKAASAATAPETVAAKAAYSAEAAEKAWQIVETTQKPEDLQLFLKVFPASEHAIRARMKLEALQSQELNQDAEESGDWAALDHSDQKALESFLVAHPSGPHSKAVQAELATASKTAAPTKHYLTRQFSVQNYLRVIEF